jgi:hypothetical protein
MPTVRPLAFYDQSDSLMENKCKKKIEIKNGSERIIQYYCVIVDSLDYSMKKNAYRKSIMNKSHNFTARAPFMVRSSSIHPSFILRS